VHVDAYRLGSIEELDDLDLDTSLDEAVTVVEWGTGVAEGLADERLEIRIDRAVGHAEEPDRHHRADLVGDDVRLVEVVPVGARWLGVPL
jgi:tRNA threonylcarbamoyladenosine biosynthesis protein TsaE